MKTIKSDILQSFLIILIFNIVAILILGSLEIYMIFKIFTMSSGQAGHIYVTVSNSLFRFHGAIINLLVPIIVYILIFLLSVIIFIFKVNRFIKETNYFHKVTKLSLETLNPSEHNFEYLELNQSNNTVNEAIVRIKKNEFMEKELINFIMHDIKTPLHIICGYNELNIMRSNNTYSEKIADQLKKVDNIIEDNVLFDDNSNVEEVNIVFVIQELIEDYSNLYENITFIVKWEKSEVNWYLNKLRFRRIIINLVDNAITALKYKGKVEFEIDNDFISIKNQGENPLTSEDFSSYVDNENLNKKGLGLKIVKKYCEQNNLELEIASTDEYTKIQIKNTSINLE